MHEPRPCDASELDQLARLLGIVRALRAPDGCPWDREQTLESMAPHLIEEAHEAADAIRKGESAATREELGDVLMNVLMLAQIAQDRSVFDHRDVARTVGDKLIRRHPHVFGDGEVNRDADAVLKQWEQIKREEAAARGDGASPSALAGVPDALPALLRAQRVGEKAARVGFDWIDIQGPRAKVDEELAELDEALRQRVSGAASQAVEEELGDVLFSVVNLARWTGVHAETALQRTVDRFKTRFAHVESALGDRLSEASTEELDEAWRTAKAAESE